MWLRADASTRMDRQRTAPTRALLMARLVRESDRHCSPRVGNDDVALNLDGASWLMRWLRGWNAVIRILVEQVDPETISLIRPSR